MEKLLNDSSVEPDGVVLKATLGPDNYRLYHEFLERIEPLGLGLEWRFYRDGGWLGKITTPKKNYGWFSIWDDGFRVTVFTTLKTASDLPKNLAGYLEPTGKLFPVIVRVKTSTALKDAITLLEFKMSIK